MQGYVLIDKPIHWTSFDVVHSVRARVAAHEAKKPKSVKVGHSGTLDPLASGLLIILIGKAYTKRAAEFLKLDKTYDVTISLGYESTTGDEEGDKRAISGIIPDKNAIAAVLQKFTGELLQTPPIYSAIKINGQRAYQLARKGTPLSLEPRTITIYWNELVEYRYPVVQFRSYVSSGTYIRSLAEDIGRALGTGAYVSQLRRESIGSFGVEKAISPDGDILGQLQQLPDTPLGKI